MGQAPRAWLAGAAGLLGLALCCSLRLPVAATWDVGPDGRARADAAGDGGDHREDAELDADGRADVIEVVDGDAEADVLPDVVPVVDGDPDGPADAEGEPPVGPCEAPPDPEVLALYSFDDGDLAASSGGPDGWVVGPTSRVSYVEGPPGCGRAIRFGGREPPGYGLVPDDDRWDEVASLDFWLRLEGRPGEGSGILSRDAAFEARPGHLSLLRGSDDRLGLRLQRPSLDLQLCTEAPLPRDAWVHVGVNLGPGGVELWVDGLRAAGTGSMGGDLPLSCATPDPPVEAGIDGNDNPWVVGAGSWASEEGSAEPLSAPANLALDHLRFSRVRRDFSVGD